MPTDTPALQAVLVDCLPSLVIDRPLAASGQRVVYLARFDDTRIPRDIPRQPPDDDPEAPLFLYGWQDWGQIVVKVVEGAGAEEIARLEAEADLLAAVRPANFPKLLYVNHFAWNPVTEVRLDKSLYITVEEFIDGSPLQDICGRFTGDEACIAKLALGIANALLPLWVHPRLFVHRDIKPANVLIRPNGDVVMIDLGVMRETGAKGVTETGWIAPHTPGYAAPEQFKGDKSLITFKTDFFAIGVVMYQLLSGIQPFRWDQSMDPLDVAMATLKHEPVSLTTTCGASKNFSNFVEKAMQKEQFRRHRTPAIFIAELEALCEQYKHNS